jgi:Family of unknown function (DUF5317)
VIIPVLGLLAVLSPVLAGGRLRRYAHVTVRSSWVLFLDLVVQVVVIEVAPHANHGMLSAVHVATYVVAGYFVWVNRSVPGLGIMAVGAASNGITIALNGGMLPASPSALATAGVHLHPGEFLNSGVLDHPHLAFLGDVFAIPAGWPLANVFSVGDVLIVLGLGWGAHRICESRLVPTWHPAAATAAALSDNPHDNHALEGA